MLTASDMMFTMSAIHHAHERIRHKPIATPSVMSPRIRRTPPMIPAKAARKPAPAVAPQAARPKSATPPRISTSPARNDRIAMIVTPMGRLGGIAPYMPGGGIEGGMLLGGIAAGGEAIDYSLGSTSRSHYISITNKNRSRAQAPDYSHHYVYPWSVVW